MKLTGAYMESQSVTLAGESAFEELYTRLARWAREAADYLGRGNFDACEKLIEKSVSMLGFMDRCIDVSSNYDIATRILSEHRFAIGALVRAKAERNAEALRGLPEVFVLLAETFAAIRSSREQGAGGDKKS
jgi:flagellin-specific chaperone FliS